MSEHNFSYLPSEIELDILSRLPVKTIMRCRCVCKSWLDLFTSPDFVKSHLSKSVPGLIAYDYKNYSKPYTIMEFVDHDVDPNYYEHPLSKVEVFNCYLPFLHIHSSCNGLVLGQYRGNLCLCNPITREYINIPFPAKHFSGVVCGFGFGVSRIRGEYKVVTLSYERYLFEKEGSPYKCEIYTIGTGLWRKIDPIYWKYTSVDELGVFLNGNIHFRALDSFSNYQIYCLDLETEVFSIFSPSFDDSICETKDFLDRELLVLGDCLCVCHHLGSSSQLDIWLMKEYGDDKSWTKEFVIRDGIINICVPLKVFKDGSDILLLLVGCQKLFYYSSTTETIREVDLSGTNCDSLYNTTIYAPSFLSLKTLTREDVSSFYSESRLLI